MKTTLAWFTLFDAVTGETVCVVQAFDSSAALYAITLQRRREGQPTVDLRARHAATHEIPVRKASVR